MSAVPFPIEFAAKLRQTFPPHRPPLTPHAP